MPENTDGYNGYESIWSKMLSMSYGTEYGTIKHKSWLCKIFCELSEQAWDLFIFFCPPPFPFLLQVNSVVVCFPLGLIDFHWVLPLVLCQLIKKTLKPCKCLLSHYVGINYSSSLLLFGNFSTSRYLLSNLLCWLFGIAIIFHLKVIKWVLSLTSDQTLSHSPSAPYDIYSCCCLAFICGQRMK